MDNSIKLSVDINIISNGTYIPYGKPKDNLLYVNISFNHPPQIIKQLPTSTAKKRSKNSSSIGMSVCSCHEWIHTLCVTWVCPHTWVNPHVSEWIHTLQLPKCQGTPCLKQPRNLKFLSDCNWTWTQNHSVLKWTLNHLATECSFTN